MTRQMLDPQAVVAQGCTRGYYQYLVKTQDV
jgi:hypothetical protein